jgi:NTE family protein
MRYIREDLAGDLGGQAQFDIYCGTSVGGIHACFFAGTSDMPARQGRMLAERWESMVLEELVAFGIKDFMKAPATLLGSGHIEEVEKGEKRLGGVVDTRQLERMVRRLTPWGRITPNCQSGFFESLSVTMRPAPPTTTSTAAASTRWSVRPVARPTAWSAR